MYKNWFLSIALLLLLPAPVPAAVIHVPGDQLTIQAGINAASDGDTVLVADGTYTGSGNRDIDFHGKRITVQSESGADYCIIDCQESYRGFYFHSGEGSGSVVKGFTIQNGFHDDIGGAIYCDNASPRIMNNIINGNAAVYGGGIFCYLGSPIITKNIISGNNGNYEGGGIYCSESSAIIANNLIFNNWTDEHGGGGILCGGPIGSTVSPVIINNTIRNNLADTDGGGIWCRGGSVTIMDNIITDNEALIRCGGIYCWETSAIIKDNTISTNTAGTEGGGIHCDSSDVSIINNKIIGNRADGDEFSAGGGIYCLDIDSASKIMNNIILYNYAFYHGAGICCYHCSPTMINNTIVQNTANNSGGGIFCGGNNASPIITNTIFWGNTASSGKEIYIGIFDSRTRSTKTACSISAGQSSVYVETNCTLNWGAGMMDTDPLFVKGPLGKYYLSQIAAGQSQDSPCVDAGDGVIQWPCHAYSICGTTRTDIVPDSGIIDIGYHYPLVGIQIPPGFMLEEALNFGDTLLNFLN